MMRKYEHGSSESVEGDLFETSNEDYSIRRVTM